MLVWLESPCREMRNKSAPARTGEQAVGVSNSKRPHMSRGLRATTK